MIREHDSVVLTAALPACGLVAGDVGVVVHVYEHGAGYEVEFVNFDGSLTFRWVKAPSDAELTALASRIASRVGRFVERQGLLERDAESTCLSELALDGEPMEALPAHAITYRIAVGPRAGRKVCTFVAPAGRPISRSVRRQARSAASVCTPAWRRGRINATSSSGGLRDAGSHRPAGRAGA